MKNAIGRIEKLEAAKAMNNPALENPYMTMTVEELLDAGEKLFNLPPGTLARTGEELEARGYDSHVEDIAAALGITTQDFFNGKWPSRPAK